MLAILVLAAWPTPSRGQGNPEIGAGIFDVPGSSVVAFDLEAGGTYYLAVAPDSPSAFLDAQLRYNGSLAAELNGTFPTATPISLTAGHYSLQLAGQGRAALGWDFTNGSVQDFPDNATMTAFVRPASTHLDLVVSMGNAQEVRIIVYGNDLRPVRETNVSVSGALGVDLPATHAAFAFVVAWMAIGNPAGVFGLAWSSPSPPAGPAVPATTPQVDLR